MSTDPSDLSLRLFVEDLPLPSQLTENIRRIVVESATNLPSMCEVELFDPDQRLIEEMGLLPGSVITVRAMAGDDPLGQPIFGGRIQTIEVSFDSTIGLFSIVRAYDAGHAMLMGTQTRAFPLMTYAEVAEVVGLESDLVVMATPTPVVNQMVVQSNETNWDFLVRLATEVGFVVAVTFAPELGTPLLTFGPPRAAETAPPPLGIDYAPLAFVVGDGRIISMRATASAAGLAPVASTRGWDQTLAMPSMGEGPTIGETAVNMLLPEELAGEFAPSAQKVSLSRLQANEAATELASEGLALKLAGSYANVELVVRGNPSAKPNEAISLSGVGLLTGEYTITATEHSFQPGLAGYRTLITCSGQEDRSLAGLQGAAQQDTKLTGVYSAIVTDVEDPEQLGRVLLSFPWLSETFVSNWARTVQVGAGPGLGAQIMPEPTDEVLVAFENGQLDSPYVLGGLYSAERQGAVPMEELIEGVPMIRAYTSRDGHQILFNDSPEMTSLTLQTTFGASCVIRMSPETGIQIMTVEEQPIVIQSNADVTINSEGVVLVNAADVTINGEGDCTINAEGDVSLVAEGALQIEALADVNINGGIVSIEADEVFEVVAPVVNISGGIVNLGA